VDVETTGTIPDRDKIIELGVCLFEYDRQNGRIYKVLGSWEWLEDPGVSIPPEITTITGLTDEMVTGHRIDDRAVDDLLSRVVNDLLSTSFPPETTLKGADRKFTRRRNGTSAGNGGGKRLGWRVRQLRRMGETWTATAVQERHFH
jgi:Exonuclease